MLVDDNEIDLFINQKVLELTHFATHITSYRSAREALDCLSSSEVDDLPDLIFLDLNMPVIDGFMFLEELEQLPCAANLKSSVVILTSSENEDDILKSANHKRVIKFVCKPLSESKLNEIGQVAYRRPDNQRLAGGSKE